MPLHTFALCDYSTQVKLNTEASNVKIDYEIIDRYFDRDDNELFNLTEEELASTDSVDSDIIIMKGVQINILNVTPNVYLVVQSDDESIPERQINYEDTNNGKITLTVPDVLKIRNYTINIYATDVSCSTSLLRTAKVVTPMENDIAYQGVCVGHSDLYYCQPFVTTEINMNFNEVYAKVKEIENKLFKENETQNNKNFWENNKTLIIVIGAIVLIIAGGTATTIFIINKRSRVK